MAKANSTGFPRQLMEVQDLLMESGHVAQFVKDMALNTDVNLEAGERSGFFFVTQDLIDRIKKAERLLTEYRDGIATSKEEKEVA